MNDGTTIRELSSVGSERLPYKQRVGGSTPSAPTKKRTTLVALFFCARHDSVRAVRGGLKDQVICPCLSPPVNSPGCEKWLYAPQIQLICHFGGKNASSAPEIQNVSGARLGLVEARHYHACRVSVSSRIYESFLREI